jgi:soluble lytic murein transglycosylase-like protein
MMRRSGIPVLALCIAAGSAMAGDGPAAPPPVAPAAQAPVPAGRGAYQAIVRQEAERAGLPPDVADAVTDVESSYNPKTVGAAGEVGLMQVMPATARMLGFAGSLEELAVPQTNIHYGVMYLAQAGRLAGGDICTATMKYRAGHGETRFSHRSVDYCVKVRARLYAAGYHVTGTVPQPAFGEPVASVGSKGRLHISIGRMPDLDALNARLRAIADAASAVARR